MDGPDWHEMCQIELHAKSASSLVPKLVVLVTLLWLGFAGGALETKGEEVLRGRASWWGWQASMAVGTGRWDRTWECYTGLATRGGSGTEMLSFSIGGK